MSGEIPKTSSYERLIDSLEAFLEDVEPRLYPLPAIKSDTRSSVREGFISGNGLRGVMVREDSSYSKNNPEARTRLRVFSLTTAVRPAATDYGARQSKEVWGVDVDETTNPSLIDAVQDILDGKTTDTDPRFDSLKINEVQT